MSEDKKLEYKPLYKDYQSGAEVMGDQVLSLFLCIPQDWTDEQAISFAVDYETSNRGRKNPVYVVRDSHPVGGPRYKSCEDREGFKHVVLIP